jgi:hypothetical protein
MQKLKERYLRPTRSAARTRISPLLKCDFGACLDNPLVYKLLKSTS